MSERGGLRILVVNWQDRINPSAGGAEEHLHRVFGHLASRGHDVTLLCSGWSGSKPRERVDGIDVHRSGSRYTFNLTAPLYYRRTFRGETFDVVVEDLNKVPMLAPHWANARDRVLLVHHLFGATAFQEANWALAGATWLLERTVPFVYRGLPCICVSESTRDDLVRRGLTEADIQVIPNGVDLEALKPSPSRFPDPTVVYLGRLKRYKRIDLILRAVAHLRQGGADVSLVVAGKGSARPELERLAAKLGIQDRVRFAGYVSEAEKRELLSRSWVHALTSPKEGWGIASLEASACGTATVASDSPGLRETVEHGHTGLLVPHGDVEALARAIGSALEPDRRDLMGWEARRMAEGYSWERVCSDFEAAILGLSGAP